MAHNPELEQIASKLSELTVMQMADLAHLLEDKWGVKPMAAAPMVVAAAPAAGEGAEQKTEFNVEVVGLASPDDKMKMIKWWRSHDASLSLAQAKEKAEAAAPTAPQLAAENLSKADADKLKAAIEASGGVVKLA